MPIHSLSPATKQDVQPESLPNGGLSLTEYTNWLHELLNQPAWRARADKEMDYVDGNQLDSEILQKQAQIGMPPAIEPLIGPAMDAVMGFEAKTRTDWRVQPETDGGSEELAKALNYKLSQAERKSGADTACSEAFRPQACVGVGWVEVSRETNPFKPPYRCRAVHRNEIFWDFLAKEADLSDARYLIRRRWTDLSQAILKFPDKADLIRVAGGNGRWTDTFEFSADGGQSTTQAMGYMDERGWSIEEQEWRDDTAQRVCLFEVWYRRWENVPVITAPDGRVMEYEPSNPVHVAAVAAGAVKVTRATIARMYRAYWMGPHKLHESRSPYKHSDFPYVPFWGKREDRTNVPYGHVRGMIYLQDNVNSAISKIRWGLSAVRVTRTKGAFSGTDEALRQMVARVDADIVLDADHMTKPGARFEVERDFQLSEQHYKMLGDSRMGIERCSGITSSFQGQQGNARSGVQEATQIEQTTQQLADLMDNFKTARTKVGELLLSLVIEDMAGKQETVTIPATAVTPAQQIPINQPATEELTGMQYLNNDVERVRMQVSLSDVPSTPSFRAQQLQAMSEAFKAMPPEYQAIALPHLLNLMDVPNKEEIITAIREASGTESPEQIQARIDEAVAQALSKAQYDLKSRELDMKYHPEKMAAEVQKMVSEVVLNGIQAAVSALEAGEKVAMNPAITAAADSIMQDNGWRKAKGDDPDIPAPAQATAPAVAMAPGGEEGDDGGPPGSGQQQLRLSGPGAGPTPAPPPRSSKGVKA